MRDNRKKIKNEEKEREEETGERYCNNLREAKLDCCD